MTTDHKAAVTLVNDLLGAVHEARVYLGRTSRSGARNELATEILALAGEVAHLLDPENH